MMRAFDYFIYGDYQAAGLPDCDNPRIVLQEELHTVLSDIIEKAPGIYSYEIICQKATKPVTDALLRIGLIRQENGIYLNTPVFIKEDAAYLHNCFSKAVVQMADCLEQKKRDYVEVIEQVRNGYPSEVNLYHMVCGAVLDGRFFDCLSKHQVVATSHIHPSDLDYLLIVYEKAPELESLSKKLLCSYNRCSDGKRTLQSFGDSEGDRFDVFRFIRQKEQRKGLPAFKKAEALWELIPGTTIEQKQERLLQEIWQLVETGACEKSCCQLLSLFGYVKNNRLAVPLYRGKDGAVLEELERLTEVCLYEPMCEALSSTKHLSGLFCKKHGIPVKELANELYHLVFGQLNEELVRRGFVAEPDYHPGEGRYLKSVELISE